MSISASTDCRNRLCERFLSSLERHVSKLRIRWPRATRCCPFHSDKNPSLSIDLEKGVFHCFGCGASGGVKRFAEMVGEPWNSTRSESHAGRARRARFQAEQQARAILQRRKDEHDDALWSVWRETNAEAADAVDLLALFHRRPDLAEEFPELVAQAEQEYGEAVFTRSILEARLNGEVE